ncbi:MAG: GAP family protein [Solirubrobacterales bacterium]|nr:GAP family protein [Solirubrobacterales bacterium]
MLRLAGIMISIGFADSLNPTTIAPALYLATGSRDSRRQVAQFTLAVFAVYLLGGLVIALGPGQLLLALLPHPGRHLSYLLEIVAGVALLTGSAFLWGYRRNLADRPPPEVTADGRSSALLGATITAVELPTAFPYFAAIAAVVGSDFDVARQVILLLLFNVCFVAPLLAIIVTLAWAGPDAASVLSRGREFLDRRWPVVLAVLGLAAGVIVTFLGTTGLASLHHNRLGKIARGLRRLLHR